MLGQQRQALSCDNTKTTKGSVSSGRSSVSCNVLLRCHAGGQIKDQFQGWHYLTQETSQASRVERACLFAGSVLQTEKAFGEVSRGTSLC
jgi:hypothetical protein